MTCAELCTGIGQIRMMFPCRGLPPSKTVEARIQQSQSKHPCVSDPTWLMSCCRATSEVITATRMWLSSLVKETARPAGYSSSAAYTMASGQRIIKKGGVWTIDGYVNI